MRAPSPRHPTDRRQASTRPRTAVLTASAPEPGDLGALAPGRRLHRARSPAARQVVLAEGEPQQEIGRYAVWPTDVRPAGPRDLRAAGGPPAGHGSRLVGGPPARGARRRSRHRDQAGSPTSPRHRPRSRPRPDRGRSNPATSVVGLPAASPWARRTTMNSWSASPAVRPARSVGDARGWWAAARPCTSGRAGGRPGVLEDRAGLDLDEVVEPLVGRRPPVRPEPHQECTLW